VRADDFRARVFHPDDVRRLREERDKAISSSFPFENEERALGKNGKYHWFLIRYNPLLDETGKVIRWYATGTDIDDRKRNEERTLRSVRVSIVLPTVPRIFPTTWSEPKCSAELSAVSSPKNPGSWRLL
jgi:PAS fold